MSPHSQPGRNLFPALLEANLALTTVARVVEAGHGHGHARRRARMPARTSPPAAGFRVTFRVLSQWIDLIGSALHLAESAMHESGFGRAPADYAPLSWPVQTVREYADARHFKKWPRADRVRMIRVTFRRLHGHLPPLVELAGRIDAELRFRELNPAVPSADRAAGSGVWRAEATGTDPRQTVAALRAGLDHAERLVAQAAGDVAVAAGQPLLTLTPPQDTPPTVAAGPVPAADPEFASDFSWVRVGDVEYKFTPIQAIIVRELRTDWLKGGPGLHGPYLFEVAKVDGLKQRMRDVFRANPAWNKFVVSSKRRYRLDLPPAMTPALRLAESGPS